jgi:hypothetical protein
MSVPQALAFFGIGNVADADTLAQGKRRAGEHPPPIPRAPPISQPPCTLVTVTWLSFVVLCVFIGAVAGPDWVKGGIEFTEDSSSDSTNIVRTRPAFIVTPFTTICANPPTSLFVNESQHFHVDLSTVGYERYLPDGYLGTAASEVVYAREDYIARAIKQSFFINDNLDPGCRGGPTPFPADQLGKLCTPDQVDTTCSFNIVRYTGLPSSGKGAFTLRQAATFVPSVRDFLVTAD